jgi:hypothetical protein
MNVPRFWTRAQGEATTPSGRKLRLDVWGWSSRSLDEARAVAQSRLERARARASASDEPPERYAYGTTPLREEIVEPTPGGAAPGAAIVTRNRYGALILNAARLLFIDVDLAPAPGWKKLRSLFGRPGPEEEARARLAGSLRSFSGRTFRLYRTAAGFRVLGVDREFEPGSKEAEELMRAAGADPRFVTLCRVQKSFRARLTPKPWRCGCAPPPGAFPREDQQLERRFREWLRDYESACAKHGTCRFVEQVGGGAAASALRPLVQAHDERTRATADLPLA